VPGLNGWGERAQRMEKEPMNGRLSSRIQKDRGRNWLPSDWVQKTQKWGTATSSRRKGRTTNVQAAGGGGPGWEMREMVNGEGRAPCVEA